MLPFPEREIVLEHLATDRHTKELYQSKKRVMEIISNIFGSKEWVEADLDKDLLLFLSDLKSTPNNMGIEALRNKISAALKDLVKFQRVEGAESLRSPVSRL
jgi:hypothetical protein